MKNESKLQSYIRNKILRAELVHMIDVLTFVCKIIHNYHKCDEIRILHLLHERSIGKWAPSPDGAASIMVIAIIFSVYRFRIKSNPLETSSSRLTIKLYVVSTLHIINSSKQ